MEIAKIVFDIMKSDKLTKLSKKKFLKMVRDRPGHDMRYALDTSFFKKTINYKMKKKIRTGLRETIYWYIKNKNWLKSINKLYNFERLGLID